MSFKYLVSALGVFGVFVIAVSYLVTGVLQLPLTERADEVRVHLAQTGGLFEGSEVDYRGVKVGRVDKIEFTGDGVVATIKLTEPDIDVPANSDAVVRTLSPAGEQFLDMQPESAGPPYLSDGDVIEADRTKTPVTVAQTLDSVDNVLDQVNEDDVAAVVHELNNGLQGKEGELASLVINTDQLLATVEKAWPTTIRVLRNGQVVLQTAVDSRSMFGEFATDAKTLAAWIKRIDPKIRRFISDTPPQLKEFEKALGDQRDVLPRLLDDYVTVTDLLALYDPHLRSTFEDVPPGVLALASTVYDDRAHLTGAFLVSDRCDYGTPERDPRNPERRPARRHAYCGIVDPEMQQRGAQYAPGPVR